MNKKTDYKLANVQKKEMKLRGQRHEILVSESEKALELILDSRAPASLVQSFPDQDLYYLMHKIGPDDFIPILAMAKSEQWEYILDVDAWDNDRFDLEYMNKTFDLLFKADPHRLLRWVIKEKPDFFEFFLFQNMEIKIREHDQLPPSDSDDYITFDDKFYFRFPDKPQLSEEETDQDLPEQKESSESWDLIEKMLTTLAQMDLQVFHGLLLETRVLLPSETEEEQFRLKNIRLAEKGFLPAHEAIGIYQPAKISSLAKRPENDSLKQEEFDSEMPLPPQFFSNFLQNENLFVKSLQLFNPESVLYLELELGALINKIISADRIKLKSYEDLEKAISKACDYLNLGLEVILKKDKKPELAKNIIQNHFLEDIFRTGSRAGIKLKTKAVNWLKNSFMNTNNLPLSFLGEDFLAVLGGLLLDRPLYYANFSSGQMYTDFKTDAQITETSLILKKIIALDTVLDKLDVNVQSFEQGVLTYKTLILTLWAKNRLDLEPTLAPIDTEQFRKFFKAFFSRPDPEKSDDIRFNDLNLWVCEATEIRLEDLPEEFADVLADLIKELEEEYSSVNPKDIDPRFIPHFILQ